MLKKVAPGLYLRTNTPRDVPLTPEFADKVRKEGRSSLLDEIVEEILREQRDAANGKQD